MRASPGGRILVGVDQDLASLRAVEIGSELAHALNWQLDLLNVLDLSQLDAFDDFYRSNTALMRRLEHERISLLRTAIHRLPTPYPLFRSRLRHGDICHILLEEATQSDLRMIVLGKTSKSTSERVLLGSVSRVMLRKCPAPLLLVGPRRE